MDLVSIVISRSDEALREAAAAQTIADCKAIEALNPGEALSRSEAEVFLFPKGSPLDAHSAEFAILAIRGGQDRLLLADGSIACSRGTLGGLKKLDDLAPLRPRGSSVPPEWRRFKNLQRHLENSGLLSSEAWRKHPVRSASRLVPLRMKERVNRLSGRATFNLDFYLRFQPQSVSSGISKIRPFTYRTKLGKRRRIALITPHLGPGGAEAVLTEMASALDRSSLELFLIATQSSNSAWKTQWQAHVDHVYDLANLVTPELTAWAVDSIVTSWGVEMVILQNSLAAYSLIPRWKQDFPTMKVVDLIHAVGGDWDVPSATSEVAPWIDFRIVESEQARRRLEHQGTDSKRIRLIRHGVDIRHFRPQPFPEGTVRRILFVGRLDAVKRPLLLVDIARALLRHRKQADFRIAVTGSGRESKALAAAIKREGLEHLFELLGYVPDVAPFLANSDVVLITSKDEGIPLVLLEAFASGRPVVSSRAGAIEEVLNEFTGVIIERKENEALEFAAAISRLLDDPQLRATMGKAARAKVESQFDRDHSRELYRELLA